MKERFIIRRSAWLAPLLLLIGLVRDSNSYVAVADGELEVRFGWFFRNRFPLSAIGSVGGARWPWYYGLGWRANLAGRVGVVASYSGVVEVRFSERQRVSGVLPLVRLSCDRLAMSLQEPERFVSRLQAELRRRS